ncbi:F0F1 ATP synthase subunit B [Magnetospira thiophila]
MQALAAEVGAHGAQEVAHGGAFYTTPEFWVFVSFVLFVILAARPIFRVITTGLDDRAETIKAQLDEAEQLRREAKDMLASYQRKQREASEEAERILIHAKEEAERIRTRAAEELKNTIKRREQQAKERIAQAEAKAMADVQSIAADVALIAAKQLIQENLKATQANKLVEDSIAELGKKLH